MKKITTLLFALVFGIGVQAQKSPQFYPLVIAESNTVSAGMDYEAELRLIGDYPLDQLIITFRGRPVVVVDGVGIVKFRASASSYNDEGESEQIFRASFTIKKPSGAGDTTFVLVQKYTVIKPEIKLRTSHFYPLYKNCVNDLQLLVPDLEERYKPLFTLKGGGTIIKGKQVGVLKIIPTGDSAVVTVASGGARIGTKKFEIRPVPYPEFVIIGSGKEITASRMKNGMVCPKNIGIKIKPDSVFQANYPKDANYYVEEYSVILASGKRPMGNYIVKGNGKVNSSKMAKIEKLASKSKESMRLIIEIKKVTRKNALGEIEELELRDSDRIFTIPLN